MATPSVVEYPIFLLLTDHPPSPNTTRGLHWGALIRRQKALREEVGWMAKEQRLKLPGPVERAKITATFRYRSSQFRDIDNATASLKPIIDGLRDGGLIVDDAPERMTLLVEQARGDVRCLVVKIEEIADVGERVP